MLILGYFLSSIMGLILGSIGAGGSILILPILVYFIGISPTLSTSYSLIIVGFTALIGSLSYIKKKKINFTIVLIFALPSLITVYLTRRYFLPILPNDINLLNILITKDFFIMILFSLLMIISALLMINSKEAKTRSEINKRKLFNNSVIIFEGILVGFFTGIIGAGGGFLIIPALVVFSGLDMKTAVGSSLFIIFIKSLFGFIGDYQSGVIIDINILIGLLCFTTIGILLGLSISKNMQSNILKKCFGWFTLFVATFIIIKETII
tara:strand:+ start:301 stop:1098 length:798 start_codon:yes stop_codon:yes gene_type:complete